MGARHANKRSKDQRLHDRVEIAQRYLRGEPQHSIAKRLGLSRQQIGYDLGLIRDEWRRSALRVERCIAQRCRILGLQAPTDVTVSGTMNFAQLYELAQHGERPRLEVLDFAGSGAGALAHHHGDGHHGDDAAPDGDDQR